MGDSPNFKVANTRYASIDFLRGLAVLGVIASHYISTPPVSQDWALYSYLKTLVGIGRTGVDLFFCLSGFLIGSILLEVRRSPHYFSTFYIRRALRIIPLYYLVLGVFFLLQRFESLKEITENQIPWWGYFAFSQNIFMTIDSSYGSRLLAVTWSLAIEEQFYILAPWFVRAFELPKLKSILMGLMLFAIVARYPVYHFWDPGAFASYVLLPLRMDSLCGGILCAVLCHSAYGEVLKRRQILKWCFLGMLPIYLALQWIVAPNANGRMFLFGYTFVMVFYLVLILLVITSKREIFNRVNFISKCGKLCYGMYLIHPFVISLIFFLAQRPIRQFDFVDVSLIGGAFIATYTLSLVLYKFFELPLLSKGRAFNY